MSATLPARRFSSPPAWKHQFRCLASLLNDFEALFNQFFASGTDFFAQGTDSQPFPLGKLGEPLFPASPTGADAAFGNACLWKLQRAEIDENFAVLCAVLGADDASLLEDIDHACGAGVPEPEAAL